MDIKIRELSEMTDSREMLESKTHPFITVFLVIVMLLLGTVLVWSYYGSIDVTAKAAAVARSNEKVSTVQSASLGKVTVVKVKEGEQIHKGDVLLALDTKDLALQLRNQSDEADKCIQKLNLLKRYRHSIDNLHNEFSESDPAEDEYYDGVEQFLLEYRQLQDSLAASALEIESAIHTNESSRALLNNDLQTSQAKRSEQESELQRKISWLETELTREKQLAQSVKSNQIIIETKDAKRNQQYATYAEKRKQLLKNAEEKTTDFKILESLGERLVSGEELMKAQRDMEAAQGQIQQLYEEELSGIENNVADMEAQLIEMNSQLNTLRHQASSKSEIESYHLQEDKLGKELEDLNSQQVMAMNAENTALSKLKADRIVQIQNLIQEEETKLTALQSNVDQLKLEIGNHTLVSPIDGTINVIKEINAGDVVQPGEPLMAIIPMNESMYKMSLAVPNSEAGKIKVGDPVKFNFAAFPKQSFGSLSGTITSIGTDSVIQQDGLSYYLVEAALPNKYLKNHKGERGEVRLGMEAQAYILTDTKRIIDFVLEKISFKQ
ncbi:HlyD family efflux transporter periplasmic adaptor subunit [Paenibacillus spiritus]|uniref:HlyD family efflux transporter periplasmic adaptor subunit n=1 Tax=Paenibacillus spiritus TaxID=2496557 RepID=A0A5J5FVV5_9BACL|nr:HlyD family efflux transporter periplasmic adaptor subunit [Paenibacillus spiritus]KAA8997928.1 HlyD family efflux transporter periplasmic adaptor subunit [Paenibacillus spiritus]